MDAYVIGEFGVESCGHDFSLTDGDGNIFFAFGGDDLDGGTDAFNLGGANKYHFQRGVGEFAIQGAQKFAFADGCLLYTSRCV